jgi:hypothetical protein
MTGKDNIQPNQEELLKKFQGISCEDMDKHLLELMENSHFKVPEELHGLTFFSFFEDIFDEEVDEEVDE